MAVLKAFMEKLAKRAGVDSADPKLKEVLDKVDASLEIDDTIAGKMESGLLDIESAKSNGTLKSHFTGTVLNGMDAELDRIATEEALSDEELTEYKSEKNTFKRASILAKAIKVKVEKLGKGTAKDDSELKKEITQLNATLSGLKTTHQAELTKKDMEKIEAVQRLANRNLMAAMPFKDKEIDMEANINNLEFYTNKRLNELGGKVKYDMETGTFKLVQKKDEALDLFDEGNNPIVYSDLIKGVGIQNKLLAVSDPGKTERKDPPGGGGGAGGGGAEKNPFQEALDAQIEEAKKY